MLPFTPDIGSLPQYVKYITAYFFLTPLFLVPRARLRIARLFPTCRSGRLVNIGLFLAFPMYVVVRVQYLANERAPEGPILSIASETIDVAKSKGRSRIGNGSALLPHVDGRSVWCWLMRDTYAAVLPHCGGHCFR